MRRGRRKGGSRDKVFGCDLLEHLNSTGQEIPLVLRSCGEFIEKHGIVDGIYRLSGVSSNTQKLRGEFDSEGSPDLYKDLYLQDIHCVSSLCKAYFRELPNPLLTYELYDRFADAVAIQLEDERLVKIKEVLKDLPALHYRTLEYLMRHLVKMSTFASQTNMHSRNLAIVWAPNLLRSKDIESTGFNGTAAFMEVRVQSIVVEFILTHVAEVFSGTGLSVERRKSLPSPSILSTQDDHFFKSLPLHCPGNLSPGDGPPAMRPYHAIIDSTDKRKGSLKGRKWKSIFNLGGRLQDPRKKNKYCPKDKEKTALRPAKSMDSLSSGPYALDDSKHHPPLVLSTASGSSEGVASAGGGVSSGYAVTYRRTGGAQVSMVSGGTPGTYNRLESGGGAEGVLQGVARSPGMTSKADRRAGIHISGPFSVTVPLHITSGLALGVLHGGWNEKEQTLQGDEAEDEDFKSTEIETESTDGNPQSKNDDVQERERETNSYVKSQVDCGKDMAEITKKENDMPEKGDASNAKEAEKENLSQNQESMKENVEDTQPQNKEETTEEDYMDMRGNLHQEPVSPHFYEDMEFPDPDLPLDFQEAFGFLDSMDSCAANQVEFSVEAPCFEEEYEDEEDENKDSLSQNCTNEHQTQSFTHRPLPGKSHSLPYKCRPFLPTPSLSSDDEYSPADDDESDKGSEYEDMFCQSLPACRGFQGLSWLSPHTTAGSSTSNDVDLHTSNQSNALPPENNNDAQSIDQSEDAIPAASASTDRREPAFEPSLCEEHLSSAVLKTDEVRMDEKKNDERDSKDVENDKHTLIGEDDLESEASEEDTYFGPDSIPSSPEPDQTETDSTSVPEPIPALSPAEDAQQVLAADSCHGNSEVTITDEPTDADRVSLTPQDQPPEEQTLIINQTKTEEGQAVEAEKREETEVIVEMEKCRENEGEECENNNKTDAGEGKCEDAEEDAKPGSAEECSDGNGEQKQVDTPERKEDFKENSGDCEENANDGPEEGEQDKNKAEKQEDLEENSGDCEENAKDGSKEEAKRQDLEKNSGECEEGDEGHAKEGEQEAKRQEVLTENNGESEKVDEEHTKEGEQDKNEAERQEDLEENSEENANDGPEKEAKRQDLEKNSGECEEGDEGHAKEGEQEAKRQEDLEENSEESEKVDEELTKEGEQDKNEAEKQEDLEENSEECEENAKAGSKEEAKRQDLEKNSGECQGDEGHAKEREQEAKRQEVLTENNGESEKVDEEHTKEGEQDKNEAERQEDLEENSEENANDGPEKEAKRQDLEKNSGESEKVDEEHTKDRNEAERQEGLEESREGNSEEDVNVKTESSVEGDLSPEGGDDPEKSTLVQRPHEMQHEQTESKEETSDPISAAPRKRKPANPTKAVPAVPPKPQNSKLTAFTLRKQLQHRQHDDKEAQATDQEHGAETKTPPRESAGSCKTQPRGKIEIFC
ncbi:stress response protein nst1 [Sinocyclocheilus rhinocerous]|uniref:stress response protein nst1 n=1 Tax=Sinocyclocheilus rhinocerous TaxID=307959 RepID=UPI0007BAC578|nr:PREDICTED: stress response protein nst1-like [Sinocyclocheilus rhinocerous]